MKNNNFKDLSYLLSSRIKNIKKTFFECAYENYDNENLIFLGGGFPLPNQFPFEKLSVEFLQPQFNKEKVEKTFNFDIFNNKEFNDRNFNDIELSRSLQYGNSKGHPEIIDFLKQHTNIFHKVPYSDWNLVPSIGNTMAFEIVLRSFMENDDIILIEEYTFPSILKILEFYSTNIISVPMDNEGIIPSKLEKILKSLNKKPKLLYTIPTGHNPIGCSIDLERKRKIYKLAAEYDFVIVEDESYYFLQLDFYNQNKLLRNKGRIISHEEYINILTPSFLSIDYEGRVVRLESFSKTLAPGVRFSWIIGQDSLIKSFIKLNEISFQTPCGFSLSIINGLLQRWGHDGFIDRLISLRHEYSYKRDVAIDALINYLPKNVVSFKTPNAGMFFTFFIKTKLHPKFSTDFQNDPSKVEQAVHKQFIKQGVSVIPGSWFKSKTSEILKKNDFYEIMTDELFFRGTYASVLKKQLINGIKLIAEAIRIEYNV